MPGSPKQVPASPPKSTRRPARRAGRRLRLPRRSRSRSTRTGRRPTLKVRNTGDRPIQVGSHFHFFEVNRALEFDRAAAFGLRLDIPARTAIRFEPGDEKEVTLVPFGGKQRVYGFNNLVDGWTAGKTGRPRRSRRPWRSPPSWASARPPQSRPASNSRDSDADEGTQHDQRSRATSTPASSAHRPATRSGSATPISTSRSSATCAVIGDEVVYGGGKTPARRHGHGQPADQRGRRASTWSSPT